MRISTLALSFILLLFFCACQSPSSETSPPSTTSKTDRNKNSEKTDLQAAQDTTKLEELVKNYNPPDRDIWQKPEMVIQKMGDLSTQTVADVGAGFGNFARRLAQKSQRVIAVEIDPRMIEFMDSIKLVELSKEFQDRFETRLGTPDDSKLKTEEVDIILLLNTYIYITDRVAYLTHLKTKLKPGGKIFIVDFKKKRIPRKSGIPEVRYRVPLFELENELITAGYKSVVSDDRSLDYQYIVMAEK